MNQNFDFPLDKLSAPVGQLSLDQRALRALRRIKIQTISQIIVAGKAGLLPMRSVGPKMIDQIFCAMAEYLEISEARLESDELRQVALQAPERAPDQLNISIIALDLPATVIIALQRAGVFLVEELLELKARHYQDQPEFRSRQKEQIDRALRLFLRKLDEINVAQSAASQTDETDHTQPLAYTDLKAALDSLRLDERAWSAVELKALRLLSREKIGLEIGWVTPNRVRQTIDWAYQKVENKFRFLAVFYDVLDERAKHIRAEMTMEKLTLNTLIHAFEQQLAGSDMVVAPTDLKRMIALVRLLVISEKPWVLDEFQAKRKDLAFLACLVEQPIKKNKAVRLFLEAEKRKREGYKKLAIVAQAKDSYIGAI